MKRCYQCGIEVEYLFNDSRCIDCTRTGVTGEEEVKVYQRTKFYKYRSHKPIYGRKKKQHFPHGMVPLDVQFA